MEIASLIKSVRMTAAESISQQLHSTQPEKEFSRNTLEKIQIPEPTRSNLERKAEHLIGPNKLTMMYADPNSDLSLATLARIVTLLISARCYHPRTEIKNALEGVDPSKLSIEELASLRKEKM